MTKYERIRQEIIAIERELSVLRHTVRERKEKDVFKELCEKNDRIRNAFAAVKQAV